MKNISPEHFLLLKQNPVAKAVVLTSSIYTFEELRQKVLYTSQYLLETGIKSNDRVAIFGANNIEIMIAVLALWQLSAVPVPLNIRLTECDVNEQLSEINCKRVLVHRESINCFTKNEIKIIEIPPTVSVNNLFDGRKELQLSDPAVILFTSGSENKSKGVLLSFGSLFNSAVNSNNLLRYSHSDRWLATLPFYHIGGFSIITRSILYGIPIIIPESLSSEDILRSLSSSSPSYISLVAAQLKELVENRNTPNLELKNCLVGGGFSDSELIKNAINLGWPVNKVYGSTETSSMVTALLSSEFLFKPNSVGRPLPSNKIIIAGKDGVELKPFEIGEVVVKSNSLMINYVNEVRSNFNSLDRIYYTGDLGYTDEDGYLYIEGRKNYLISTGGENVNPLEVEKVLLQHPFISEAAVFPIEDKQWGEIVAATVVLKANPNPLTYDDLKSFLLGRIAGFKIPKKIFFAQKLPRNELGKVEKNKLNKLYML